MRTQRFGIEIEMTYPLEYCPNCPQGSIARALNLVSLMDCNIYDEYDNEPAEDLREEDPCRFFLCEGGSYADQCTAPKQTGGNPARAL